MIKNLLSVLAWVPVLPIKAALFLAGLVVVPLYIKVLDKEPPSLWRLEPFRPFTVWEGAIRNPVGGFAYFFDPKYNVGYKEWGVSEPEPTVQDARFAWRFRRHGLLSSLRCVWRYNDTRYGELYFGWKLGSVPYNLDFATSIRPFALVGQ